MPTLSSLYFKTKSHMVGLDNSRKPLVLEYHEENQPFKRKPLSEALRDALRPVLASNSAELDLSDSSESIESESSQTKNQNDTKNETIFDKF